jgi:hypothetical protein
MRNNCLFVDCQQTYYHQIFKREDSNKTEMTVIRIDDKHELEQNQSIYVEIVRVKPQDGDIPAQYGFSRIQPHIFMNVPHP